MKKITKMLFSNNLRKKILSILLITVLMLPITSPTLGVNATVVDGSGNTLSGANSNYTNLSNSGAYQVDFVLSGTLDIGDTFRITTIDGSGNTSTGSYLSASGGESSGSILLNLSASAQGVLSYTGIVYSGGIVGQVVASGITMTGILDTIIPGIILSSTGGSTISGATIVNVTTSEIVTGLTIGDISVTNATTSGFSQTSSTGYTFTISPTVSTGTVLVSIGTGLLLDVAGNPNITSNTLSFNVNIADTTSPLITITSHSSGATITASPTLTGTVSDSGSISSVMVNGSAATLGTGTWSKVVSSLTGGSNTITVVATDASGNTGSTSILVNRVSLTSNVNATLSGTTSAVITFNTDLTATGVVLFGTGVSSLNSSATGTTPGTSHSFTLSGLLTDTIYYYLVQGQGGTESAILQFKTPTVIGNNASGSITATGSIYLSGSTATGVTFSGSGTISISSITSNGSQIFIPVSGLTITASGGGWDGVIQAPEVTSNIVGFTLSGYTFTGSVYEIGNPDTELIFSGQTATVTILLGSSLSGQTVRVYRSTNGGTTYSQLTTCVVTGGGDCIFTTNQLSLFGFAIPADTIPSAFSLTAVTSAELSTLYTSNSVVLAGTNAPAIISITGGSYSINSGAFTTVDGAINTGDSVVVRATSSASYSTVTNTTLTIGGVASTYSITTKAAPSGGGGGSSSGPGGGGGGGGSSSIDSCIGGDLSPSYYDGLCTAPGTTVPPVVVVIPPGGFNIPAIIISDFSDINFRDISNNWAENYIIRLVIRGIIDNANFYRPNNNLTRAEFLKIVINTTGWIVPTQDLNVPFDDVRMNDWYAKYISMAISKGMITTNNVSFRPNYTITRAEATKILIVALGITVSEPTSMSFTDTNSNSDLTKYIEAAKYLNILTGQIVNGRRIFRPNDSITRAEIAKIVVNAFHL